MDVLSHPESGRSNVTGDGNRFLVLDPVDSTVSPLTVPNCAADLEE